MFGHETPTTVVVGLIDDTTIDNTIIKDQDL